MVVTDNLIILQKQVTAFNLVIQEKNVRTFRDSEIFCGKIKHLRIKREFYSMNN